MPELPEVETIKLGLQKKIINLKIQNIKVLNVKSFIGEKYLTLNKKIESVWRRSKILGINLEGDISLLFHLKMTGQVIFECEETRLSGGHPNKDLINELPVKSTRVIFELDNGSKLYFNDQRKFGWIKVVKTSDLDNVNNVYTGHLGPEPLNLNFSPNKLKERLVKRPNLPIKTAIMDQNVISGLGNIYACEACFNAQINPSVKTKDLTSKQIEKLTKSIKKVLKKGIKLGGSTISHFVNSEGEKGNFLKWAYVYNRKGLKCKVCNTYIKSVKQAGRSTYYCPTCQK